MPQKKVKNLHDDINYSLWCETHSPLLAEVIKIVPGIIYWKNKEGAYLGCNENMLKLAGMSSIVGKTDFDLPWHETAEEIRANDLMVMEHNASLDVEERGRVASGKHMVALTRKTPLRDEHGAVIGVIGTSLNITERKEYESSLLSSHEEAQAALENIVANMPGHVYWKDKEGVYLGCNHRQAQSLGFRYGEEVVGKTDFDLPWGADQAELFRANDLHIMESGQTEIIEEQALVDGKPSIVLSHKSPMRNRKGEVIGVLGISIDISDRKKMEAELHVEKNRAEAASIAKTEFLENMRHDIRTPLSGIVGFSELIQEKSEDPQIKQFAAHLVSSSHALLNLLDEVLEAIHVSSGELPKLKKKFKLETTVHKVMDLSKARALSKQLELSMEFDTAIPAYLVGDEVRLHRIMLELLSNALNFTHSGFVRLHVSLAKEEYRNVVIQIKVQDSGIGIPKEKQQEIFLQFKRLTPSYKGIYKGTGLGLSVIKQFIDELDGEIYVRSVVNQGTEFTCLIPFKKALLNDASGVDENDDFLPLEGSSPQSEVADALQNVRYRVLLVEDNHIAQMVAKSLLRSPRYEVDLAIDGQSTMDKWQHIAYDLVLMDIGLPDMSGIELASWMRQHPGKNKAEVPIIALTAHVGDDYQAQCLAAGMDLVLSKPLTYEDCKRIDALLSVLPVKIPEHKYAKEFPRGDEKLFQLDEYALFDVDEGIKHTGSLDNLHSIIRLMLEQSLHEDLEQLHQARVNNDWEEVQKTAHKIKGGLIYVGAVRFKMACQYLERYWKAGQRELLADLYEQMLKVSQDTQAEINQWLAQNPSLKTEHQ